MKTYNLLETLIILLIVGFLSMVSNTLSSKTGFVEALPGLVILILIAMAGIIMGKYLRG